MEHGMNLIALADEQLDVVAGGCGRKEYDEYGSGYDKGSRKHRRRGDVNVDNDVQVLVVNFEDNEIDVDGDFTVNLIANA